MILIDYLSYPFIIRHDLSYGHSIATIKYCNYYWPSIYLIAAGECNSKTASISTATFSGSALAPTAERV